METENTKRNTVSVQEVSEEWNIHHTWSLTQNILIPGLDENGNKFFDTNSRGEYFQLISTVVLSPKENPVPSKLKRLDFESEIFILKDFTDNFLAAYINKVMDGCLKYQRDFRNVKELPLKKTLNSN